jgi:HEPN domain-containing protein
MENNPDVLRWLSYANEDWNYGKLGVSSFPRAAAWSFQQAAEKSLKALLIRHGVVPPRTHDLLVLFNLISQEQSNELRNALLLLAEITASARYPDDTEPVTPELAADYGLAA